MTPKTRLRVIVGLLTLSAIYAVLVGLNPDLAQTVALGYIAILLTLFTLVSCWKRPSHA